MYHVGWMAAEVSEMEKQRISKIVKVNEERDIFKVCKRKKEKSVGKEV